MQKHMEINMEIVMEKENQTITINGRELEVVPDETILSCASRNMIDIPTLCHLDRATSAGNCGICVVEINGMDELVPACSTIARPGWEVRTESPKVAASRKKTIQAMLSEGNHNCAIRQTDDRDFTEFQMDVRSKDGSDELCPVWGDCRLQDLAYRYQVTSDQKSRAKAPYPMELANPFIIRDFSRCIRCGRCIQACNEVQVNLAIQFDNEQEKNKVITPDDKPLRDSECVFCGECVQACPVGALVEKDVRYRVRHWETRKVRTTCSYCGVGCQLYLHVKDNQVVKVTGVEGEPPNYGSLCVKGRFGFHFIGAGDRLTTPLIKENGTHREASWDEALDLVAKKLTSIRDTHGPDSFGMLCSARISNEENYIAQKFARAVMKTNSVDHCARL